jgi:hypothetical protein
MGRTTTIIEASTGTEFNFTSGKARGDAYYGYTDGSHTVAFYCNDFTGRLYIDATLANDPVEADWFSITLGGVQDYIEATAHTGVVAKTFQGNLVYLRARIDRSHLTPANNDTLQHGQVTQVLLNH